MNETYPVINQHKVLIDDHIAGWINPGALAAAVTFDGRTADVGSLVPLMTTPLLDGEMDVLIVSAAIKRFLDVDPRFRVHPGLSVPVDARSALVSLASWTPNGAGVSSLRSSVLCFARVAADGYLAVDPFFGIMHDPTLPVMRNVQLHPWLGLARASYSPGNKTYVDGPDATSVACLNGRGLFPTSKFGGREIFALHERGWAPNLTGLLGQGRQFQNKGMWQFSPLAVLLRPIPDSEQVDANVRSFISVENHLKPAVSHLKSAAITARARSLGVFERLASMADNSEHAVDWLGLTKAPLFRICDRFPLAAKF